MCVKYVQNIGITMLEYDTSSLELIFMEDCFIELVNYSIYNFTAKYH